MPRVYLKYTLRDSFGVVCSSNAVFEAGERTVLSGALERVVSWNLKRGELAWAAGAPSMGSTLPTELEAATVLGSQTEVSVVALSPDGATVSTGHLDGSVRLWPRARSAPSVAPFSRPVDDGGGSSVAAEAEGDFDEESLLPVALSGHRSAVTSLAFGRGGALLASGARDTDVVVWDVTAERGLFRLRGHTAPVTAVCWLAGPNALVTCSRDGLVKVWDADSQQCIQTVVGHMSEVLCACLAPSGDVLYTGASDGKLRVWRVVSPTASSVSSSGPALSVSSPSDLLIPAGELVPSVAQLPDAPRVRITNIAVSGDGRLLACIVGERVAAFWRILGESELEKKRKRREQRANAKRRQKGKAASSSVPADGGADEAEETSVNATLEEEHRYLWPLRATTSGKIRSISLTNKGDGALLSLSTNTLELYSLNVEKVHEPDVAPSQHFSLSSKVALPGHRSDVRAAALTTDDALLVTVADGEVKIWSVAARKCLRTVDNCGYGLCVAMAPGNRHALVGTKEGTVLVVELQTGLIADEIDAHRGAVWSICTRPDGTGIVSGSADHSVKFWDFDLGQQTAGGSKQQQQAPRLTLVEARAVTMDDDVLAVRMSPDGSLLAVALLDCTVKVFKAADMKFFLSLFGHKLPVLSIDFSFDSRLLASGSADKNIKIWGMDFGDCHKSLFAHSDSVTQIAFVPRTHYLFSVGKDGALKHWDTDKFELIQKLDGQRGQSAACWCVAVGGGGTLVVTSGHDRSIRVFERTHEQLFLEEERERELDAQFEAAIEEQEDFAARNDPTRPESEAASRKNLATVRSGEELMAALDMAEEDAARQIVLAERASSVPAEEAAAAAAAEKNPLMMGLDGADYVLRRLAEIPSGHLEQALMLLPFHHAASLLRFAATLIERGRRVELCAHCVFFLLRLHHAQIAAAAHGNEFLRVVDKLLCETRKRLQQQKDLIGFNLAAMRFLQQQVEADGSGTRLFSDVEEKLAQVKLGAKQKKAKKKKKTKKSDDASIQVI